MEPLDAKNLPSIAGYRLIEEIGHGQAATVYKALRLNGHSEVVALKLLRPASEGQRRRFEREVEVQKSLDCPGVVRCLDSGRANGALYYAMEFVEGVALDAFLASATTLDEKLLVFERLCDALAQAHARGVAHRDLKPANVLVDAQGQPHILDFGICALQADDWSSWLRSQQTQPGDIIGTIKYMSPEQAWGGLLGPIDHRTDIWSLGVILFEMATGGRYPYKLDGLPGKSITESLLHRIRHERPETPRIVFPPYAAQFKTLIDACLAHEPDRRLSSAAALAADVRCVREGQRIGTARRSRIHSLKRLAIGLVVNQPHALRVSGLAAVLTFLTVLTFSYGTSWRAATPQHSSAVSAKPVAIVGVGDSTAAHVMKFAGHAGLPGVTADIRTWRAVHGNVMRRLVAARPQVVVWDYYFESAQPSDADFVAGARELLGAGVPVVLAVHRYDEQGQPVLSPGIYQALRGLIRHGAILARDMGSFIERRGEFVTALRHAERIYPSLALATLGAIRHPDGQLSLEWPLDPERRSKSMDVAASEWSPRDRQLTVRYARRENSEEYLAGVDRVPISREIQATAAALAAQRGDLLACTSLDLQPPDVWRARTVPYESLLDSTDDNCVAGLSGRIVIIGDIRSSGAGEARDRHAVRYRDGSMQTVPGCFLLADAICGLSAQEYLVPVFPPTPLLITLIGVAVVLGLALTIPLVRFATFRRAFARRAALTGTAILAAICFHQMRRAEVAAQGMLLMFGAALFTAAFAALLIELARARYRIPIVTLTAE